MTHRGNITVKSVEYEYDEIFEAYNVGDDIKTSLQRDLEAGKNSEIDTLIFGVSRLGKQYGIPTPCYDKVSAKFS